jgi:hypothetical protein
MVAVNRDAIAGLPGAHRRTDSQDDTGGIAAHHLIRLGVTSRPLAFAGQTVERTEGADRLEDAGPHRVEVDAARHDCEVDLVGRQLGRRHVADVQTASRILVGRSNASPHVLLAAQHMHASVRLGNRQVGDVGRTGIGLDGVEDLLHRHRLPTGSSANETAATRWPAEGSKLRECSPAHRP